MNTAEEKQLGMLFDALVALSERLFPGEQLYILPNGDSPKLDLAGMPTGANTVVWANRKHVLGFST